MDVDHSKSMRSAISQDGKLRTPPNAATVPEHTSSSISIPLPPLDLSKGVDHPDNCKIPEDVRRELNEKLREWKAQATTGPATKPQRSSSLISVPLPPLDLSKGPDHPDNCKIPEDVRKELNEKLRQWKAGKQEATPNTVTTPERTSSLISVPLPPLDLSKGVDHPDDCKIPEDVRKEFSGKSRQWKEPSNDAIHHLGEGDEYLARFRSNVRKALEKKLNDFRDENAQAALVNDFSKVTIDVYEDYLDMVCIPLLPHDLENGMPMTVVPPKIAAEFNRRMSEGPVKDA